MGRKVSPTLVGGFVLGALALAVAGVAVFGSGRLFRATAKFVIYFDRSVNGLRVGAPVKFKGVEMGSVSDVRLSLGQRMFDPEDTRIPVIIDIDPERLRAKGGRVMVMDEAAMRTLVNQGLRAQLNTESFVTGVLYVEIDFFPGTPATLVQDPSVPYVEIPTLPTTLEQVQHKAAEIITKLGEIDFKKLGQSITDAVDGVNQLVNSPGLTKAVARLDGAVQDVQAAAAEVRALATDVRATVKPLGTRLVDTSAQAEATLASVQALVQPGAALPYQLGQTLAELAEAARALRDLAAYLERNPSAIVRGKPTAKD